MDDPESIRGKRVLVVEDGPTLTHGEMKYGAAFVAARRFGAKEIVDPTAICSSNNIETRTRNIQIREPYYLRWVMGLIR